MSNSGPQIFSNVVISLLRGSIRDFSRIDLSAEPPLRMVVGIVIWNYLELVLAPLWYKRRSPLVLDTVSEAQGRVHGLLYSNSNGSRRREDDDDEVGRVVNIRLEELRFMQ